MVRNRTRKGACPAIKLDRIRVINRLIPYRISESIVARSDKLATAVLRLFFGQDWIDQHIIDTPKASFLSEIEAPEALRERQRMRRIILAEMLFNLQKVEGFRSVWTKMLNGDVESTYGALEIARMLVTTTTDTKLWFRFVPESKIIRRDYDLSIRFSDGVAVRAETKCKMEETEITLRTVQESLSRAKKQLPQHVPGMVFIKIPREWIDDIKFADDMRALARRSIKRSPWIVSVKFYAARIVYERDAEGESTGEIVAFSEHTNDHHKFRRYRTRNWHMFPPTGEAQRPRQMNYNGLPSTWQRLFVRSTELPE
ncbi:hypothetical protein LQG66_19500 [Bradyrhizobium ontarionense]|uniref:Uncharacterized protein n=1 Tax=Bradyrhizobium ontarionense TaxID=2898149 RepID=A0ABY3R377_9BRAD|nr:hypothetical protein [Bradyrhizobium sp. A19]UFZ01514.1 hypothetical protein LQG66_19500 [Bradyrhizobium sp. A19]